MQNRVLRLGLLTFAIAGWMACTHQNPDQLREKTADATSILKRDTKAVAEGVKEGLTRDSRKSVDLNKASKDELSSLPGITTAKANRIIAERPYAAPHQLVTRHVLSEDEYAQLQNRVTVTR
ncbi:MAG TPA: helix-hairpin-helix domain-containing protein [Candidatus Sulfotelmatobacter sp.]|jgi:DNA uptake protein ComE-like DNA-binding protein